ncbi:MAG: GNAT family N-acetyltransferase [Thermoanaerobaculia bacterium]|nr:GNAT family N-acetyltransferase [Thermoanaerobaculia bacterium]
MVREVREEPGGATGTSGTYPAGDEEDVALKDGTAVHLRPIRGADEAGLLALYDRLSPESLYFRFFSVPQKDTGKAAYLTHVDYDRRYAVVAETAGAIVGVARWERLADRPGHAEVAFTVADDVQGRGLGGILFRRLAALARARGITVFEAEVLKNNERMLRVFERTGLPTATRDQGNILTILLTLDPPAPPPA